MKQKKLTRKEKVNRAQECGHPCPARNNEKIDASCCSVVQVRHPETCAAVKCGRFKEI